MGMAKYAVKKGEQVKSGGKIRGEGEVLLLQPAEAEAMPWAVEPLELYLAREKAEAKAEAEAEKPEDLTGKIDPKLDRKGLNELAGSLGIKNPASLPNKAAVLQAIEDLDHTNK